MPNDAADLRRREEQSAPPEVKAEQATHCVPDQYIDIVQDCFNSSKILLILREYGGAVTNKRCTALCFG